MGVIALKEREAVRENRLTQLSELVLSELIQSDLESFLHFRVCIFILWLQRDQLMESEEDVRNECLVSILTLGLFEEPTHHCQHLMIL